MNRRNILTLTNTLLPTLAPAVAVYTQRDAFVLYFSNNPVVTFLVGLVFGLSLAFPTIALISENPPYRGEQQCSNDFQ